MSDSQILDIFYKKIVPEAKKGRIDCYFILNIIFDLTVDNVEISKCTALPCDGVLIPTLKITNKQLFDRLLIEYVKKALNFYNPLDFSFLNDLDVSNIEKGIKEEYIIKYIISSLFANASFIDFSYPVDFLYSRIAMFDNKCLNYDGELNLGYIDSIGANIYITEEISPIKAETPYSIKSYLLFDDGYKLLLPEIYVGNSKNKYYLYGIQKTTKGIEIEEKSYLKRIRKGFMSKINGAPEHYFLAVMLFLSLCSDKKIEVVSFLVERWNAKKVTMYNKIKNNRDYSLLELEAEQIRIQNNITDILIRYFTKLEDVSKGIDFTVIPFELSNNLNIKINSDFESKSPAFNELFKLVSDYKYKKLGR